MKRRIEKLFNEAGFHKPEVERLGIEHKFEKFAELLIKECADVCLRQSRSGWNDDRKAQARLDYDLIKEHFGVEE